MNVRSYLLGFFTLPFILIACASTLEYPYFGMDMSEACFDQATLLGVNGKGEFDEKLDEPMAVCKDFECLVMKINDHERLETDLAACRADLKACEEGN